MKNMFLLSIYMVLASCSDDSNSTCYPDRQITGRITDIEGTVVLYEEACGDILYLQADNPPEENIPGLLFPGCDLLPESFRQAGTRVIFSGIIYQLSPNVDVCAHPFELTEIEFIDP